MNPLLPVGSPLSPTPGPWEVKRGQFGSSVFVIYGPDGFPIAQTVGNTSPEGMERARAGVHEANARHIVQCVNAAKHPGTKLRKPSASAQRGLKNILTEMRTIAADMSAYRSKEEHQRGRDILAGIAYIEAAIAKATGEKS